VQLTVFVKFIYLFNSLYFYFYDLLNLSYLSSYLTLIYLLPLINKLMFILSHLFYLLF